MKKIALCIFLFNFIGAVYADCTKNSCSTTIKRIYITSISTKKIYIEPSDAQINNLDCTLAENKYIVLKYEHPLFSETYSAALAAVMANKTVTLRVVNGSSDCQLGYIMVYGG